MEVVALDTIGDQVESDSAPRKPRGCLSARDRGMQLLRSCRETARNMAACCVYALVPRAIFLRRETQKEIRGTRI